MIVVALQAICARKQPDTSDDFIEGLRHFDKELITNIDGHFTSPDPIFRAVLQLNCKHEFLPASAVYSERSFRTVMGLSVRLSCVTC